MFDVILFDHITLIKLYKSINYELGDCEDPL